MNKENNNVTANQASANVDASKEKEEAVMNNTAETENVNVQQENVPAEQQNDQVPAVAEPEKVSFWTKVKNGAKKVGKVAGIAALVIGGCIVGEKIGEAVGFDKATDNYDKLSKSGSSSDDEDDEDEEDEIDGGDYTEVDES